MNYLEIGDRFQKIAKFSEDYDESKYWQEFFCHFSCCIFALPQRDYNGNGLQKANCSRKGLDLK